MKRLLLFAPFVFLLVLSYFAIKPLFIDGFYPMHDDTQVARVFEMAKSLKDGQFPVRWVADLGYGYGYPIFNFYAPLAYYVGAFFNLIGFDALVATKLMIATGMSMSAITMYLLGKEFWGRLGGALTGLLYMLAPYQALNVYVRGDIGEVWAYGFVPVVFLSLYKFFAHAENLKVKSQNAKSQLKIQNFFWVIIGALGYAGIILSHNLTAMMITPFVLILMVILGSIAYKNHKDISVIRYQLLVIVLGLALSAFYWLPVPFEMKYTNVLSQVGGKADYRLHFVCLQQLWDSPWGFGGSAPGCLDGMSYRIGKIHIILAGLSIISAFLLYKKYKTYCFIVAIVALLLAISIWLTTQSSMVVWDVIPLMAFLQYPWRFLLVISFLTSFLGGSILFVTLKIAKELSVSKKRFFSRVNRNQNDILFTNGVFICLSLVILFFYTKLFNPQTILPKFVDDYTDLQYIRWVTSKISDEYMPKYFQTPLQSEDVVNQKIVKSDIGDIDVLVDKTQEITARITMINAEKIVIRTAYFPGWQASVDGKDVPVTAVKNGMELALARGSHIVTVKRSQTTIEQLANFISLSGIVVLVVGIMRTRKTSH